MNKVPITNLAVAQYIVVGTPTSDSYIQLGETKLYESDLDSLGATGPKGPTGVGATGPTGIGRAGTDGPTGPTGPGGGAGGSSDPCKSLALGTVNDASSADGVDIELTYEDDVIPDPTVGNVRFDNDFLYLYTPSGVWKRVALAEIANE
jgi:hypothetical protein